MVSFIDIANGWQDGSIYDTPVNGIGAVIDNLRMAGYNVVIYSTRCGSDEGRNNIRNWLEKYNIKVDGLAIEKPIAAMYVDDRAIQFNGNCRALMRDIHRFKSWTEKTRKICPCCGDEFVVDGKASNRQIYCSPGCRIEMARAKQYNY